MDWDWETNKSSRAQVFTQRSGRNNFHHGLVNINYLLHLKKEGNLMRTLDILTYTQDEKTNTEGYIKISKYIQQNADQLLKESQE